MNWYLVILRGIPEDGKARMIPCKGVASAFATMLDWGVNEILLRRELV